MREQLVHEFEELDLSPYEARILLALLRLGAANTAQLARESGVPRTSTYEILEELNARGLAQRVSVEGPTVYASPGRDEVFNRLDAAQEERLHVYRERTFALRRRLAAAFPEGRPSAGPYVHVIQGASQVATMYDRLLAHAKWELLVFNRPPYSEQEEVNPAVLEALGRGVKARVLYEAVRWSAPADSRFCEAMAVYHAAGVEGRLVDTLPLKLVVVDRETALLAMADPVQPEIGFPTTLLVEHPGYARLQADAFEQRWASATPVPVSVPVNGPPAHRRRRG